MAPSRIASPFFPLLVGLVAAACASHGASSTTADCLASSAARSSGGTTSSSSGTAGATPGTGGGGSATTGTGGGGSATVSTSGAGGSGSATVSTSGAGGGDAGGVDPGDLDQDGDGWTPNQGDCCDVPTGNCLDPAKVNPGAFEYPGNGVDDDCNPATPDDAPPPSCSPAAIFGNVAGNDLVQAMDLCQFTTESPPLPMKRWGVISADLVLADGVTPLPALDNVQAGVLSSYGPYVAPQRYATMAAISSGTARALGDPGYVHPKDGTVQGQVGNFDAGTQVGIPAQYLAAHGGTVPLAPQCPGTPCSGAICTQAFDSVNLKVRIRVPTNASSFSYQFKFYSSEFPQWVCNRYNDTFITLLQSSWMPDPNASPPQAPLPADGNIAFDAQGNPVNVNNGFFQVCFPPFAAAAGTCPSGTLGIVGNGMGGWGSNLGDGGGTDWLTNSAPVVPGETIELQFIIWDAGDHNVDSLVLLDHFRWSLTPSPVSLSR
jgi:hypothetical protein